MSTLSIATAFLEKLPKFLGIDGLANSATRDKSLNNAVGALFGTNRHISSITREASKSVASYPMVVSNAISMDAIVTINKHLEIKLAHLIKVIISNNDIVDLNKGQTKTDIIQALQNSTIGNKNSKFDSERVTEAFELMDMEVVEFSPALAVAEGFNLRDSETAQIKTRIMNESGAVLKEHVQVLGEGLNEFSLDALGKQHLQKFAPQHKAIRVSENKNTDTGISQKIEKINEIAPTILDLEIVYKGKADGFHKTRLVIGVKVLNHPVKSESMVEEVGISLRDDRFAFRAIQWFTGEISFFRDLVLNYSALKRAAMKDDDGLYFKRLKDTATNNARNAAINGKAFLPTTTLVLTMDEVDQIKEKYQVDIMSRVTALKLITLMNLLGLIVIDEPVDTMYVLDDITGRYDKLSIPKEKSDAKQSNNIVKALVAAISNK